MRYFFLYSAFLCYALASFAIAQTGNIFGPNPNVERIFDEGTFTEAITVSPDGRIFFANIVIPGTAGDSTTFVIDPKTLKHSVFRSPNGNTNGMKFNAAGELISVQTNFGGSRNVMRTNIESGETWVVAARFNDHPFNGLNDIAIDHSGNIYVTDPRYLGDEAIEQPVNGVYRIDNEGRIDLVVKDLLAPNGVALSPDDKTLYVSEHPYDSSNLQKGHAKFLNMSLESYAIGADGSVKRSRTVADFGRIEGVDGLFCDESGLLWTAFRDDSRRGIRIFSPEGRELDFLALPEKPSNLARSADKHWLYITAGKSVYRVNLETTKPAREFERGLNKPDSFGLSLLESL